MGKLKNEKTWKPYQFWLRLDLTIYPWVSEHELTTVESSINHNYDDFWHMWYIEIYHIYRNCTLTFLSFFQEMSKLAFLTDSNLLGKDQLIQNENAKGIGDACEAHASRQALCQTLTYEMKWLYT